MKMAIHQGSTITWNRGQGLASSAHGLPKLHPANSLPYRGVNRCLCHLSSQYCGITAFDLAFLCGWRLATQEAKGTWWVPCSTGTAGVTTVTEVRGQGWGGDTQAAKGNWTGFMILPDLGFLSVWSFLLNSRLPKNVLTTCICAAVL